MQRPPSGLDLAERVTALEMRSDTYNSRLGFLEFWQNAIVESIRGRQ
jgi:hypothetical protein